MRHPGTCSPSATTFWLCSARRSRSQEARSFGDRAREHLHQPGAALARLGAQRPRLDNRMLQRLRQCWVGHAGHGSRRPGHGRGVLEYPRQRSAGLARRDNFKLGHGHWGTPVSPTTSLCPAERCTLVPGLCFKPAPANPRRRPRDRPQHHPRHHPRLRHRLLRQRPGYS